MSVPVASSPHSWGSVRPVLAGEAHRRVFPTLVGVCRTRPAGSPGGTCPPHARGGLSMSSGFSPGWRTSSPHAWGSVLVGDFPSGHGHVFPIHARVSPRPGIPTTCRPRLPYTCGGLSIEAIVSGAAPTLPTAGRSAWWPPPHSASAYGTTTSRRGGRAKARSATKRSSSATPPRVARSRSRDAQLGRQQAHPDLNLPDPKHATPELATQRRTSENTPLDAPGHHRRPATEPSIQYGQDRKLQVRRTLPWASHFSALEILNRCHQPCSFHVNGSSL